VIDQSGVMKYSDTPLLADLPEQDAIPAATPDRIDLAGALPASD
jgi:hypothetical protein